MEKNIYHFNNKISKSYISICCFVLIAFFIGTQPIYAQGSGNITGKVIDKSSGDELPFANVYLEGTSFGSATDEEGKYILHQIPAGNYNLITAYIGYKEQSIPVIVVAGSDIELDIKLDYAGVEGDVITVTAQASGQMGAINQQLNSNTITNVVSADRIKDVPDGNAAESVSRLPGMSLVRSGGEGQKVAVRGISPKYNVMQVNGVRMQSTDRNDRSVDLNMIAPNILSGIEVTKALTADMDADAVGGTVNLKIGKASEGLRGNFSLQGGYSSLSNTYENYRATGFLSNRFFNNKFGVQVSGFADHFNRSSDVLSAGYAINEISVTENGNIPLDLNSVNINDRDTERERLGGSLVFDYQFKNGSLIMNNFISKLAGQNVSQSNNLRISGFEWTAGASSSESSNTVVSNALQGEFDFPFFSMDFSFSNSISGQLSENTSMNIGIAQSASGFTTPSLTDPSQVTPAELLAAAVVVNGENDKRATRFQTLNRDVTEQAQEAALNFNVPFSLSKNISGKVKLGGKYVRNFRDNDETQRQTDPDRDVQGEAFIILVQDSLWPELGIENIDRGLGIRAFLFEEPSYEIGDFLSGDSGIDNFFYRADISKMIRYTEVAKQADYYVLDIKESTQYDYDYGRNLFAFYASAEVNFGKYVTLFPGIRYENFNFNYNAFDTEKFGPLLENFSSEAIRDDNIKGTNWFPQLQLRVKPNDWFDIRFAKTKSIIYPDYRSISPYRFYDSNGSPTMSLGNPSLQPALSDNYDIYASIFQNKLGLITIGAFYKEIDNLIVSTSFRTKDAGTIDNRFELSPTQQTVINTWLNLDATSTVRGIELDWQHNTWYLPSFLKGIVLNVNYTKIQSQTAYPLQTSRRDGTGPFAPIIFIDTIRTGRMPDQPNDIFNFTIGYDIGGFSTRLSYVYTDNVLDGVNRTYDELDSYTAAYKRWDFTAYQKLPWLEGRLQVYLNVNNLTNTPDRSFTSVLEKLSSLEYYGRTVDLGVRYSFHKLPE
ncbi:TonB-dependent receptor [Portibacter lacus]|uniref:TonB-dependent receptor n=1 Tax=Portibacter lacus TaxID=1099794 RepID=A0AA37SQG2_9BACT|nr:TonB-dependent receptor [Portibacter lacus]GLR17902.1 TonB-dependent receptor [Portibacter lacus]